MHFSVSFFYDQKYTANQVVLTKHRLATEENKFIEILTQLQLLEYFGILVLSKRLLFLSPYLLHD